MSYQITITPKERAAGRFVSRVRRALQKALAEEHAASGLSQSDIARVIGVNRSVISREIRGHKDLTLSRVGEIAWALGRLADFDLPKMAAQDGSNITVVATVIPAAAVVISHQPPLSPGSNMSINFEKGERATATAPSHVILTKVPLDATV